MRNQILFHGLGIFNVVFYQFGNGLFRFETKNEGHVTKLQIKVDQEHFAFDMFGNTSGKVNGKNGFTRPALGAEYGNDFAGFNFFFCRRHFTFRTETLGQRSHDAQGDERIQAQQHVKVQLVNFKQIAFGLGFDRCIARRALDQGHFTEETAFIVVRNAADLFFSAVIIFINFNGASFQKIKSITFFAFFEKNGAGWQFSFLDNFRDLFKITFFKTIE